MNKKTNLRLTFTLMAVLLVSPSCSSNNTGSTITPAPENPSTPKQEVLTEADPTIFQDTDGTYYLYGTGIQSDRGFFVYQSKDLKTWEGTLGSNNGFCLTGDKSFGTSGFWAPQVLKRGDTYYMYYTANEQIAVATSTSPLGPFTQKVKKPIDIPGQAIDPYVFFDNDGKVYLFHVRFQNGIRIFVAEMTDDLMEIKEETAKECIHASEQWENTAHEEGGVNEGPTVLRVDDTYYLFYSANPYFSIDYSVGVATAKSPYGPWIKSDCSVINRGNTGFYGTGHGDIFKDAEGNLNYVLHTHNNYTEVQPRKTALVGLSLENSKFSIKENTFRFLYKK